MNLKDFAGHLNKLVAAGLGDMEVTVAIPRKMDDEDRTFYPWMVDYPPDIKDSQYFEGSCSDEGPMLSTSGPHVCILSGATTGPRISELDDPDDDDGDPEDHHE